MHSAYDFQQSLLMFVNAAISKKDKREFTGYIVNDKWKSFRDLPMILRGFSVMNMSNFLIVNVKKIPIFRLG